MGKKKLENEATYTSRKHLYFDKVESGEKGGCPRLVLNEAGLDLIHTLAGLQCTIEEIACGLGVNRDTLYTAENKQKFLETVEKGRESGKISLRRYQFKLAQTSATMAIFLGKQYLGQREEKIELRPVSENENIRSLYAYLENREKLLNADTERKADNDT